MVEMFKETSKKLMLASVTQNGRGRVLLDSDINRPKGNAHLTFFKVFFFLKLLLLIMNNSGKHPCPKKINK